MGPPQKKARSTARAIDPTLAASIARDLTVAMFAQAPPAVAATADNIGAAYARILDYVIGEPPAITRAA